MKETIKQIQSLDLTDKHLAKKAKALYNQLVKILLEKYGNVDDDFDCNPIKRGAEWLDIHHIDETEMDNIAQRTNAAKKMKNAKLLDELKIFNKKERLIYANKIEHFLLHYLIDCIQGQESIISGGPHFCWDSAIALEYFILKQPHLIELQKRKDFYSDISLIEITKLYKKFIDWHGLLIPTIKSFWKTVNFCEPKDARKFKKDILSILRD